MKRPITLLLLACCLAFPALPAPAATASMTCPGTGNALREADRIVGEYSTVHQGEPSKVRIFRNPDGSYTAQVFWIQNRLDKDGKVRLDEKNPDKSLRDTPCDRIVLIRGMRYLAEKDCWTDAKIYDPVRGFRANVRCFFNETGKILYVRGSIMGMSETVQWKKLK